MPLARQIYSQLVKLKHRIADRDSIDADVHRYVPTPSDQAAGNRHTGPFCCRLQSERPGGLRKYGYPPDKQEKGHSDGGGASQAALQRLGRVAGSVLLERVTRGEGPTSRK